MSILEGTSNSIAQDDKIAILVSRFNEEINENLLTGATTALEEVGVTSNQIDILRVPGAFEIPFALQNILKKQGHVGVIVLSTVVKGDTDHDQYVAAALTEGVSRLSLEYNIPISYGVITSKNWKQAEDRSGGKHGNRGRSAAQTCLEMIDLKKKL
jgi:6,7-dimethyl-8-ribityllumazine synthase